MRTTCSNSSNALTKLIMVAMAVLLSSCGGSGPATTPTGTSTVATISLTTTGTSVKSDGTNSVTITATALTAGNAVLPGEVLNISTTTGQISASTGTTDANGAVTFTFSAGAVRSNATATITVSAVGSTATASIPILISGSTLTLATSATSAATGTPVDISAVAKDAGAAFVANQTLRYSIAASSTGSGTLSATTGTTDAVGFAGFTLTGTASGTVNILVEWLNAAGTVTASNTISVNLTATGGTFSVATPSTSPFAVSIGSTQNVVVNVPASVSNIRYATTLGTWAANGLSVYTAPNGGATDTQTFQPGTNAGNASVQIDALDASGNVIATANLVFSITANTAASIVLQSNVANLPPSTATTSSTATLTAIVKDAVGNPVGGAPVVFTLINSTGTGETLSPVVATTNTLDPKGVAQATFTAGTSTTQNAAVRATVVGTAIFADKTIVVGGSVGSIAIGVSNKQSSVSSDTAYKVPVTVLVSDSNGNAVSGATVSLSLWPVVYHYGYRDINCLAVLGGTVRGVGVTSHLNEDANRNYVIDAGENTDGPGGVLDSLLWPAQADGGTIPTSVVTDANGTATFDYVFLKKYANWLTVRLTASTTAQGNPTAYTDIYLLPLAADVSASACGLPDSPYN